MQKLSASRFVGAEHKFNQWAVTLEHGTPYKDVFERDFWAHIAKNLQQGDLIHVRSEDHTFYAKLYVRASGPLWAKVGEVERAEFASADAEASGNLEVKWNVGKRCFNVVRKSDNAVIQGGFQIKEDAAAWIADHNSKMAA